MSCVRCGSSMRAGKAVLVHDPFGLGGRLPSVEDGNLLHPHHLVAPGSRHWFLLPCGFPETGSSRLVPAAPVRISGLSQAEEVLHFLAPAPTCSITYRGETSIHQEAWYQIRLEHQPQAGRSHGLYLLRSTSGMMEDGKGEE